MRWLVYLGRRVERLPVLVVVAQRGEPSDGRRAAGRAARHPRRDGGRAAGLERDRRRGARGGDLHDRRPSPGSPARASRRRAAIRSCSSSSCGRWWPMAPGRRRTRPARCAGCGRRRWSPMCAGAWRACRRTRSNSHMRWRSSTARGSCVTSQRWRDCRSPGRGGRRRARRSRGCSRPGGRCASRIRSCAPPSRPSWRRADGRRPIGRGALLDAEPATADRAASHLLACEPAADAWVAQRLRAAAERATARGAPEAAGPTPRARPARTGRELDRAPRARSCAPLGGPPGIGSGRARTALADCPRRRADRDRLRARDRPRAQRPRRGGEWRCWSVRPRPGAGRARPPAAGVKRTRPADAGRCAGGRHRGPDRREAGSGGTPADALLLGGAVAHGARLAAGPPRTPLTRPSAPFGGRDAGRRIRRTVLFPRRRARAGGRRPRRRRRGRLEAWRQAATRAAPRCRSPAEIGLARVRLFRGELARGDDAGREDALERALPGSDYGG